MAKNRHDSFLQRCCLWVIDTAKALASVNQRSRCRLFARNLAHKKYLEVLDELLLLCT
jgi:hypothetical protein